MYRVIGATVIFDTLWSLVSFGHPQGLPIPGRDSPIDAVDDFFRVRQVCTLLDTCGGCFNRGSQKQRMDQFLVVFQLYVLCKADVPMDVNFMLNDTFEVGVFLVTLTLLPESGRRRGKTREREGEVPGAEEKPY